jgi:hypothetical protein
VQVHYNEGVAIHIGPEPCAGVREDVCEASVGERAGQPLSHDRVAILGADAVQLAEGNTEGCVSAHPDDPAWSETLACTDAPCAGTGRSLVWPVATPGWSASGRRGAIADDERTREVILRHSSDEACEQGRETGCGAGGAKGADQGEHGSISHAPGTEPGKRATRSTDFGSRSLRSNARRRPEWMV